MCDACVFGLDTLLALIVPGLENNILKELIIDVCIGLNIASPVECDGAINNYWVICWQGHTYLLSFKVLTRKYF